MSDRLRVISPVNGEVFLERPLADDRQIEHALTRDRRAQADWRAVSVAERATILNRAVNGVDPALMAGNTVILKHSAQTPLWAERFAEAFQAAGLPEGVFQHLRLSHDATTRVIGSDAVDFVSFTGS